MGFLNLLKKNKKADDSPLNLNQLVKKLKDDGFSDDEIEKKLLKDLKEGGEFFGDFREQFKSTQQDNLDKSDKTLYSWLGIDDKNTCPDCSKRQKMNPKNWREWEKIGLPGDGSTACKEECRCTLVVFDPEMELINSKKSLEEKAFKSLKTSRENPEKVISCVEPLCNKLLEIGKSIKSKDDLGIYFWIDNLSIAYLKVGDLKKAYDWIKIGNDLPKIYRKRSSKTEQERLQKRFERCKKKLNIIS